MFFYELLMLSGCTCLLVRMAMQVLHDCIFNFAQGDLTVYLK